jgi:putative inorganic carbon (HCO3(-)) transporter
MSLQQIFDNQIVPVLSLSNFDSAWRQILDSSGLFGIWLKLKAFCHKNLAVLGNFAWVFENCAFLLVALLFFVLAAPQFADDKGVLAIVVVAAFVARTIALLLTNKFNFAACSLDALVLAFVAMNIIATAASEYLEPSLKGLSKMAVYFCSYFLFIGVFQINTRRRTLIVLAALLSAAFVVSLYGLYQYKIHVAPLATWEDPTVEDKTTRVFSTLKNPNLLAGYLIPLIPLSLGLTIMSFYNSGWKRWLGIPMLGVSAVIMACAKFTDSRGGFMGIGAGLAAIGFVWMSSVWSTKPKARPFLILAVVVILIGIAVAVLHDPRLMHRIESIASTEHSSNAYRMHVYRSSLQMFKDSWWFGIGPGNSTFKLAYGLYMKSGFDALGTYCVPLEVAVETGVVGLLIFGWMIVCAMSRAHQYFWANPKSSDRWIAAGASAGLLAMTVHGMVDTVFYRPQVQFLFWLLLALCACWTVPAKAEIKDTPAVLEEYSKDQNAAA